MYHLIISSILLLKSKEEKERTTNKKHNRLPTRILLALHFLAVVMFLLCIFIFASSFSQSRLTPKLLPCLPSLPPSLPPHLPHPSRLLCLHQNRLPQLHHHLPLPRLHPCKLLRCDAHIFGSGREGGREGGRAYLYLIPPGCCV